MRRADSFENTLILGKLKAGGEDDRGWDGWMASPIQWTWVLSKLQDMVKDREAWHASVHVGPKESDTTEWLNNKNKHCFIVYWSYNTYACFLNFKIFFSKYLFLLSIIVDLQCCANLCCIAKWLSYTVSVYVYLLGFFLYFKLWLEGRLWYLPFFASL